MNSLGQEQTPLEKCEAAGAWKWKIAGTLGLAIGAIAAIVGLAKLDDMDKRRR